MRLAHAGLVALLTLCATQGRASTENDPKVLVVGTAIPAALDVLDGKTILVSARELGEELTSEQVDMVYFETMPADPGRTISDLMAKLPRDRPLMLVVNRCDTPGRTTEPDEIQAAVADETQVIIAVSDNADGCDAEKLAETFAAAAVEPAEARRDVLVRGGYRLIGQVQQPRTAAPRAGALVITALPTEAMSMTSAAPVVLASVDPSQVIDADQAVDRSVTFAPQDAAAATRPGGPQPSVVLGDLAVLVAADARGPLGMPFEVREEIRKRDPAMFDRLLSRGAFDPVADQTNAAIQTELARMNCYSGGIDGQWGRGSSAALGRYYEQTGSGQSATEPEIAVYRTIIGGDTVTCPDVQPVARANTGSRGSSPRTESARATTRAAAAPRRSAPAPQPQQQRAPATRQITLQPGLLGSGVVK